MCIVCEGSGAMIEHYGATITFTQCPHCTDEEREERQLQRQELLNQWKMQLKKETA